MTAAIIVIAVLASIFCLGVAVGAVIRFGNPSVEEPLPGEIDPRLLDLHHELHTTRWTV